MELSKTYTIQGFEGLNDKLKEYAISLGWNELVADPNFVANPETPEITAEMVSNPITYIQFIFSELPMKRFWDWIQTQKYSELVTSASSDSVDYIQALKDQTTITETAE